MIKENLLGFKYYEGVGKTKKKVQSNSITVIFRYTYTSQEALVAEENKRNQVVHLNFSTLPQQVKCTS